MHDPDPTHGSLAGDSQTVKYIGTQQEIESCKLWFQMASVDTLGHRFLFNQHTSKDSKTLQEVIPGEHSVIWKETGGK